MAAKKKKKAKKSAKPAKARKAPARTSKAKKAAKRASKKPARKAAARKAPAKKKKQTMGEGDYAASRSFFKDESGFVGKHKASIPVMAKAAEKALEGPEGDALREAEATAAARSRDTF